MEQLLSLLSQPITQLAGIVALAVALQKKGVDVRGMIRTGLGMDSTTQTIAADNRDAMQPLMLKLDELTQYANHETTEHTALLREIRDSLRDNFGIIHAKHSEWDRRGIPTEDCKK